MKKCGWCGVNKPVSEFYKRRDRPGQFASGCRECRRKRQAKLRDPLQQKLYQVKHKYGLEPHEYEELLAESQGVCSICSRAPTKHGLSVDHCHDTGKVRGLICNKCNASLGLANDDPEILRHQAKYLEQHAND